jgi:hypothetical protein
MARAADPQAACPTSCGVCGAGEFCYAPSGMSGLPSFCARACVDSRDCKTGEKCAVLFAALQPAVCVSDVEPAACGATANPNWHCDFPPDSCRDANTLDRSFSQRANRTCGHERVHCDNGCDDTTSPAHCK